MVFTVQHTLDERLVQYLITEETLDVQHVLSLLCLVSKHHCIQAYFVTNVFQEYFEINTEVSIDWLFAFLLESISNSEPFILSAVCLENHFVLFD